MTKARLYRLALVAGVVAVQLLTVLLELDSVVKRKRP